MSSNPTTTVARPSISAILTTLLDGQWLTLENLAASSGYSIAYCRQWLRAHPLADWRPLYGQHRSAGAPVKEWTLQVLRREAK